MKQRAKKRIKTWLWCTKHGVVSASVGCIHLLTGESSEWIKLRSRECPNDWVCPGCRERLDQSTLTATDLMPMCTVCLREVQESAAPVRVLEVN
jgi:hypothetical protein